MKEKIKNSNDNKTIYKVMLSYCLKCRKNMESKNPEVISTENGRIMLLSLLKCVIVKKQSLLKSNEASGLLSSFGIKTPLKKIPLLGPLLF